MPLKAPSGTITSFTFANTGRAIGSVDMSTVAFIGVTPNPTATIAQPTALTSWRDFQWSFGPGDAGSAGLLNTDLSLAVYGFYQNGGRQCYVVNLGQPGLAGAQSVADGLAALEKSAAMSEFSTVAAPGFTDKESYEAMRQFCDRNPDRVAILDGPASLSDGVLEVLSGESDRSEAGWTMPQNASVGQLTMYVPWLRVANLAGSEPISVLAPPSGAVAGIWARSEAERGVWKAPANERVKGAIGLEQEITQEENGALNERGVNVIREFPQRGILVWGANMLSNDPEWRYVAVRRTATMIELAITRGTRWTKQEINDERLWQLVRQNVSTFLTSLWRAGGIVGNTPEEAFIVNCDAETNPDPHELVFNVAVALTYPATFHTFQVRHTLVRSEAAGMS